MELKKDKCCNNLSIDVNIQKTTNYVQCICGSIYKDDGYFSSHRFVPIDEQDISELTEILEKELIN